MLLYLSISIYSVCCEILVGVLLLLFHFPASGEGVGGGKLKEICFTLMKSNHMIKVGHLLF